MNYIYSQKLLIIDCFVVMNIIYPYSNILIIIIIHAVIAVLLFYK